MIPTSSLYPDAFDSDNNLFLVHDSLRLRLLEDYNPGDTSIKVEGDFLTVSNWPATGLITLTEQCSELDKRAISFYYSSFDATNLIISGLELLPEFTDVKKPKRITDITVNVMDRHHNNCTKSLMAIQKFSGVKGTVDREPFGDTLEGRINFLRKVVLQPKAWFEADITTGNVPLEVEFNNRSFRLGTDGTDSGDVKVTWDFGDRTSSTISIVSLISADSVVPDGAIDVLVRDTDSGKIKKTYHQPGLYSVILTVENNFGSDVCVFENFINARVKAPDPAIIRFIENTSNQQSTPGVPPDGPFETTPKIRSPINTLIEIEIEAGENPATPDISYGGETLVDGVPIDMIINYTWELGDDLSHPNSRVTTAAYSVGGIYDLKLRVDTQFGAYRITTYNEAIDIIETKNLWLWNYQDTSTVRAYEYGLISETFKLTTAPTYTVLRNDAFLDGVANEVQQKREFNKNTGFAPRTSTGSGLGGTAMLYYASGRNALDPVTSEVIRCVEFDGFSGTYVTKPSITRQWNWAALLSPSVSYFIFGTVPSYLPNQSPTNTVKQGLELSSLTVSSVALTDSNYLNESQELKENIAIYDNLGNSIYGNFSVHRTAWKDSTGYLLRNDGVGPFFRIKNFYRTEGTSGAPFTNIRKLQDIQGPTKTEGELVQMSASLVFLNNTGSVSSFNPTENIWRSGGPGVNSLIYRGLQDTTKIGYDDPANTLLAASDGDKRAYLSFDYSPNAYLKFNEIDLTFVTLGGRPSGTQWIMGVY